MYVNRHYSFLTTAKWSRRPFLWGFFYSGTIALISFFGPVKLVLPWQPVSVLGIAVAFYLGFKNNSSYDRTWEARKIWGGIVNHSRTFATAVISMLAGEAVHKRLIYRHIAWLIALRHQLRLKKQWEHSEDRLVDTFLPEVCEAYNSNLIKELTQYLSKEEMNTVIAKSNVAAQILLLQSKDISELNKANKISDYKHVKLHEIVGWLYDEQGKSERIKNFPFPRQYASTAL